MRVQIVRTDDDYVLNERHIDELLDDGTLANEQEACAAEEFIGSGRIYYLKNADTYLRATPCKPRH